MTDISPVITLGNVHGFAARVAEDVEPGLVVQSNRLDDKRIPFPMPYGEPHPGRVWIFREWTSVHVNLAGRVVDFGQDDDLLRCLNDFKSENQHSKGDAAWK